jgi:hypothetical protein
MDLRDCSLSAPHRLAEYSLEMCYSVLDLCRMLYLQAMVLKHTGLSGLRFHSTVSEVPDQDSGIADRDRRRPCHGASLLRSTLHRGTWAPQ